MVFRQHFQMDQHFYQKQSISKLVLLCLAKIRPPKNHNLNTFLLVEKQGSWQRLLGSSQNVYAPFQLNVSVRNQHKAINMTRIEMKGDFHSDIMRKTNAQGKMRHTHKNYAENLKYSAKIYTPRLTDPVHPLHHR